MVHTSLVVNLIGQRSPDVIGRLYRIEAKISGPDSWVGREGLCVVEKSGVTFTFSTSAVGGENGTKYSDGQFPELLFSV